MAFEVGPSGEAAAFPIGLVLACLRPRCDLGSSPNQRAPGSPPQGGVGSDRRSLQILSSCIPHALDHPHLFRGLGAGDGSTSTGGM